MRPENTRVLRKGLRVARKGEPTGRRVTHPVETAYGRHQRDRDWQARWTVIRRAEQENAMNEDTDRETWAEAVRRFSCPFCGRGKGQPCTRVEATYSPALPDLAKPHITRLRLLTEPDQGITGSFS